MLFRKNAPLGRSRFSSAAMTKDSTHTSGAQISERIMVFFRPSRNMGFFQILT